MVLGLRGNSTKLRGNITFAVEYLTMFEQWRGYFVIH